MHFRLRGESEVSLPTGGPWGATNVSGSGPPSGRDRVHGLLNRCLRILLDEKVSIRFGHSTEGMEVEEHRLRRRQGCGA